MLNNYGKIISVSMQMPIQFLWA